MENIILLGTKDIHRADWSNNGKAEYSAKYYIDVYKEIQNIWNNSGDKTIYGIGYYVIDCKHLEFYFIKIKDVKLSGVTLEIKYEPIACSNKKSELLYGFENIGDQKIIGISTKEKFELWLKMKKISINSDNYWGNIEYMAYNKKVFIVYGHNELAMEQTARFVTEIGLEPIILREQASSGKTIIEKIEEYSNVGFGIVLYTPCDVGASENEKNNLQYRARQNVVFEHGYLIGKLGREKVCALVKGDIEKPNDIAGVVYIPMNDDKSWRFDIIREMKRLGYDIDTNKLV